MADISLTAANFLPSSNASILHDCVAGATLTRGQSLYYDSATSTYKLFDADGASALQEFAGLACQDIASGQKFDVCTKDPDLKLGGTLASGDNVWGSATAGGVTKTVGDLATGMRVWSLGVATSTTNMNFNPVRGGVK